jgi:hypothetical protein
MAQDKPPAAYFILTPLIMTKRIAIVQSNYIPWKGYFDMIRRVDEFILFDDMQYTRRDWRNRNRIKTPSGVQWLTIPVQVKGKYFQAINETRVDGSAWAREHWRTLAHNYGRAPYFKEYAPALEHLYMTLGEEFLSRINYLFLRHVCDLLGIKTAITWSTDYRPTEGKTERLISLCKQAGATEYLSGPAARCYIQEELFVREGIGLSYMDYTGYPEYRQLFPPFEHAVTVLDLLFNEGPDARKYMLAAPQPASREVCS